MGNLIKHPAYKYVRDYQTFHLTGGTLLPGQQKTFVGTLPFRFIVTKLVGTVVVRNTPGVVGNPDTVGDLINPPVTTVLKYHQAPLDNQPIPFRNAWGTARKPAILPIPWAVEQGTNISVECTCNFANTGAIVGVNFIQLGFQFVGYQPSDEEFEAIKRYNDANFIRPYQTFTPTAQGTKGFLDFGPGISTVDRLWSTDFPLDFFATKLCGSIFDVTGGNELFASFIPSIEEPDVLLQMFTKSAQVNTLEDMFRGFFGDAKFPMPLTPSWQFKQGDVLTMLLHNHMAAKATVFPSLIGYVPAPGIIRAGDVERGRTKPEAYVEQAMNRSLVPRS